MGVVSVSAWSLEGEKFNSIADAFNEVYIAPPLTVEYLIVAGGGGGGTDWYSARSAGGGGAGGMLGVSDPQG